MNPEDDFQVTITNEGVSVEHPQLTKEQIRWADIETIKIITTDQGPFQPDVWLALLGNETGCLIPQGAAGYETVYDRVSQYPDFNFDQVIEAMTCSENREFLLWSRL